MTSNFKNIAVTIIALLLLSFYEEKKTEHYHTRKSTEKAKAIQMPPSKWVYYEFIRASLDIYEKQPIAALIIDVL